MQAGNCWPHRPPGPSKTANRAVQRVPWRAAGPGVFPDHIDTTTGILMYPRLNTANVEVTAEQQEELAK
jgi:hypothetical protein